MAVGSAFDAYVKSFLHEKLIGKDSKFEFKTLFEAQVDPHNRDEALIAGKTVYDHYHRHGALVDILRDLEGTVGKPRFETSIDGYVDCVSVKVGAVPLLGKPDIYFLTPTGARIIFDWKVTGYYSNTNYSPKPGYIRCLPKREPHKNAFVMTHDGFSINVATPLDKVNPDWAAQLSIYAWLLGQSVGSKFIVAIDEVVCNKNWMDERDIRIAQHRALVSTEFQYELFGKAHAAWYGIQGEHIFDEVSLDESQARCKALDARMQMENGPKTAEDEAFDALCS